MEGMDPVRVDGGGGLSVVDVWPLGGLKLSCGDLTLRPLTDEDCLALGLLDHDLLDPEQRYFLPDHYWDGLGENVVETTRLLLQRTWRKRAELMKDSWSLEFAVLREGVVVGLQGVSAVDFSLLREVRSGSRVGRPARGQGVGLRMRAMMLEFVFAHLGALMAHSGYVEGNEASRRISEKLGYRPNGVGSASYRGERLIDNKLLLSSEDWLRFRPSWLDEMRVVVPSGALQLLGV